ncbi:MAG: arginine--tRNA ligase [Candidatus Gastranaerophilales bacterium]|nr:arginine--tRNA ligase [Candidatus Gastranaerophilales bacterium]
MMLKDYFSKKVENAINLALKDNKLGQMEANNNYSLPIETPKNTQFGDFAVNVSSLARFAKMAPPQIAAVIADYIEKENFDINIVSGFINFKLGNTILDNILKEVLTQKKDFAKNNLGKNEKVMIEYVSANPTGPFHIGHGRWAAMGSALANIMKYSGYDVYQEFYINDAGSQIQKLGKSLHIRILQELGVKTDFPQDEEEAKNFYTGDYLIPLAKEFVSENKDFADELKSENELSAENLAKISKYARLKMLSLQKKLLEGFNTHFDNFFSEITLHESGQVQACIDKLQGLDMLYEKEGAVWFKSTKYGDDQDRVIKKTDGAYTYLTADIAYHYNKLQRGFQKLINIWGADHHGYVPRMRASIESLGYNPNSLEVLLGQLVNLVIKGEQVRMGKRTKMITLDDLIHDVGVDGTRFWMIMRSIDTTLDFDVELAKSKSDDNPVFYVQYAHARACSIVRNAVNEKIDTESGEKINPVILKSELDEKLNNIKESDLSVIWAEQDEKSVESTKKLILKLEEYRHVVASAAQHRTPYLLTKYLQELAANFHQFYTLTKVLVVENKDLMIARLGIVNAVSIVLESALDLIGVSAPQRM